MAHRLSRTVDRVRQIPVNLGLRPYRVFLVWERATGDERGEGKQVVMRRFELLPVPKVESLDALSLSLTAGGVVPLGSVRVSRITASLTKDILNGDSIPSVDQIAGCGCKVDTWALDKEWDHLPVKWTFYIEVVEDGRGDDTPTRQKFALASPPVRRAGKMDWTMVLERVSEEPSPHTGLSQLGDDVD
jgi:hypothetical protein